MLKLEANPARIASSCQANRPALAGLGCLRL
jgi:hypothetical protein